MFATIILLVGCQKNKSTGHAPSASPPAQNLPAPSSVQVIARIHWLGIKQLSNETNAARFMGFWNIPQSQQLERQTLDKLSLAPWPLLHRSFDTNAATLVRPLLEDLVEDGCYLEIREATNQPGELALAIRLNDQRAAIWQTNLARVLESLTDIRPVPAAGGNYGWSLKKHHVPNYLELARAGGWTIFGAGQDHNTLVNDLETRLQHGQAPFMIGAANDWLTVDANLRQVANALALNWNLPDDMPEISLAVTGDGTNVLIGGNADFPRPLALDLKPWNIPTNLIDSSLASFTMVRGVSPWLKSLPAWNALQIGPPPDQACIWALRGLLTQSYFAAPLPDASNEVDKLADWVLQHQHHWFATNSLAKFEKSKSFNGLEWKGLPLMSPFVRSMTVGNQNFIYGGGFPNAIVTPLSIKVLQNDLSQTNLIYHDWEVTSLRTEEWTFMGQFARLVLHRAQLPPRSLGLLWLETITPKLGASVTDVTQTGPGQLSFTRKSEIGLTGIELNLLADWLESPQFPLGLHTLLAPRPAQP